MSFTLPKNPKDLDQYYKTDLDFEDCFGRKKTLTYDRRNTVLGAASDKNFAFIKTKFSQKIPTYHNFLVEFIQL